MFLKMSMLHLIVYAVGVIFYFGVDVYIGVVVAVEKSDLPRWLTMFVLFLMLMLMLMLKSDLPKWYNDVCVIFYVDVNIGVHVDVGINVDVDVEKSDLPRWLVDQ